MKRYFNITGLPTLEKVCLVLCLVLGGFATGLYGQTCHRCIAEVKALNAAYGQGADSLFKQKTVQVQYTVRAEDWEDVVSLSNVTVYKNAHHLHFFTEQFKVYQDTNEVLMIVPNQRVAFLTTTSKQVQNVKLSSLFYELQDVFFDSCKVLSCETTADSVRTLVLKAGLLDVAGLKIDKVSLSYDVAKKKVLSVKTEYVADYQLKSLGVVYKFIKPEPSYVFNTCKRYFLDAKGKRLAKYADYEFEDARDKVGTRK